MLNYYENLLFKHMFFSIFLIIKILYKICLNIKSLVPHTPQTNKQDFPKCANGSSFNN